VLVPAKSHFRSTKRKGWDSQRKASEGQRTANRRKTCTNEFEQSYISLMDNLPLRVIAASYRSNSKIPVIVKKFNGRPPGKNI
jgi:hypothetical protein